ncbi:MAG: hypothetical protein EGQ32_00185 [Prevotella sp.]|nr:hypothetical protein [Prevotella sp.]
MKKKKLLWQLPFLAFLIIGTVVIVGRQKSVPYQHDEGRIFGTTYHITYQSDDNLKKEIEETLKAVDQEFSMFNPQSTVALINEGKRPTLSDDFLEVYQLAQQVNEESDGAFDITVAPLVNAWGFGFKNQQMPNNHQIDSLRRLVGMEHVSLAGAKGSQYVRFQRPRMMLDFSAIAKGCTVLGDALRRRPLTARCAGLLFAAGFLLCFAGTWLLSAKAGELKTPFLEGFSPSPCLMAAGLFSLCTQPQRLHRPAERLSRASFCIYLVHIAVLRLLGALGLHANRFAMLSIPAVAVLCGAISYFIYLPLSKLPWIKRWLI